MRVWMENGAKWICNLCGHIWRMKDEERPPVHCAKCKQRRWDQERQVEAEL